MNRFGMKLARARLGDSKDFTDFPKTAIFLVVQTKHRTQSLRQRVNGVGNPLNDLALRCEKFGRTLRALILDRLGELQSRQSRVGNLREQLMVFFQWKAEFSGYFFFLRRPPKTPGKVRGNFGNASRCSAQLT
jgi:hypothetical protein